MRSRQIFALPLLLIAAASEPRSQTPAPPAPATATFDVVSIKPNTSGALGSNGSSQRPDGGFTLLNIPVGTLIGQAYSTPPIDMVGLPGWAMSERYDVTATSPLERATPEERAAMLRAMLAERLKLAVRVEPREQPVYDLVLTRSDGRLGPGIKPSDIDCVARLAAERQAADAARAAGTPPPPPTRPDFNRPPPPCTVFMTPIMNGTMTIASLAMFLRSAAGRVIVDKTGLTGSYDVTLDFDRLASQRGPEAAPTAGGPPSVFTAVQEQLGMRLESSRAVRDTLIIDRLERPTPD